MAYVDGFVLAVPKDKLDTYKAMARECAPIWKENGAIDYVECVGDDVRMASSHPSRAPCRRAKTKS